MKKSDLVAVEKLRNSYSAQKEDLDKCLENGAIKAGAYRWLVKELKKNTKDQYSGKNAYLLCID